jgi:uncharacterized membrane protein
MNGRFTRASGHQRRLSCAAVTAGWLCISLAGPLPVVHAQCAYSVQAIIQAPPICIPGEPPVTMARGMSSYGVVGFRHDCNVGGAYHSFFWSPDTGFVTLAKPQGVFASIANDITPDGVVVGYNQITGVGRRAYLYDMKSHPGEYTYLEPLHGVGDSWITAVNSAGTAFGARSIGKSGVQPYNAALWTNGKPTDLGVMHGPNSEALDGNSASDAAGWAGSSVLNPNCRAFLWVEDDAIPLGLLHGTINSVASLLNNHREVMGGCRTPEGPFIPFIWSEGQMSVFLPPNGFANVGVGALSDHQIVGRLHNGGADSQPFVWQHGEFHRLKSLVVDIPQGVVIETAGVVGNDGRILARGTQQGAYVLALLLVPIDQPLTDLNHDCRTDVHDLLILLEQWGPAQESIDGTPSADFNGDGVVDVLDLLILLDHWDL